MLAAAADERFEEAARLRNRLFAVRHLAERQAADKRAVGTVDVIGIAVEGDRGAVQIFPLREGKMIDRYAFHLENVEGATRRPCSRSSASSTTARRRASRRRSSSRATPATSRALEEFLSERRGSRVEVRRGGARREAAPPGARRRRTPRSRSRARRTRPSRRRLRRVEALEELREVLNLESLPIRIECFDISNIQGEDVVGSMVVFQDAMPKKAHYRKFGVQSLDGQDDFAAMAEVISRRFARLSNQRPEDYDESFVGDAEPRRDRRRQGPALGGAGGDAGVRPAPRGRDRAREAGRGGVLPRAAGRRSCCRRHQAGPPAAPADSRRGAPLRGRLPPAAPRHALVRVDLRHAARASGRRAGARS